jgi:uncharacterized phage protein gp47/JayE
MPVTIPTTKEISDKIVTDVEAEINQNVPLLAKSFIRVTAKAFAGCLTLVYKYGKWLLDQIFPQTQDQEALLKSGELIDLPPNEPVAAVLALDGTGTNGSQILTGERLVNNAGIVSIVQDSQTVVGGVVSVTVSALTTGEAGNVLDGGTLTLVQPVGGIDSTFTVTSTIVNGEDGEELESYRDRIVEKNQNQPQGGSIVDYIIWGKQVTGITRVFVERPSPGVINTYPIQDNDPISRIPTESKLTEVQDYYRRGDVAPFQADPFALAADELEFDIEVNSLIPDTTEVRNRIAANFSGYLLSREPQQFTNQTALKNVVSKAELIGIATQSGAQSLDLTLTLNSVIRTTPYTLAIKELAELGVLTFV